METQNDVNQKIIDIVDKIRQYHPELLKYLDEMSITLPTESNPKMNIDELNAYLDSLLHIKIEAEVK